jgi:hypothetical protein
MGLHGLACPQVADARDGLQIWRVAANMMITAAVTIIIIIITTTTTTTTNVIEQVGSDDTASDFSSGGDRFESRPGQTILTGFPQSLQGNNRI